MALDKLKLIEDYIKQFKQLNDEEKSLRQQNTNYIDMENLYERKNRSIVEFITTINNDETFRNEWQNSKFKIIYEEDVGSDDYDKINVDLEESKFTILPSKLGKEFNDDIFKFVYENTDYFDSLKRLETSVDYSDFSLSKKIVDRCNFISDDNRFKKIIDEMKDKIDEEAKLKSDNYGSHAYFHFAQKEFDKVGDAINEMTSVDRYFLEMEDSFLSDEKVENIEDVYSAMSECEEFYSDEEGNTPYKPFNNVIIGETNFIIDENGLIEKSDEPNFRGISFYDGGSRRDWFYILEKEIGDGTKKYLAQYIHKGYTKKENMPFPPGYMLKFKDYGWACKTMQQVLDKNGNVQEINDVEDLMKSFGKVQDTYSKKNIAEGIEPLESGIEEVTRETMELAEKVKSEKEHEVK